MHLHIVQMHVSVVRMHLSIVQMHVVVVQMHSWPQSRTCMGLPADFLFHARLTFLSSDN